MCDTQKEQTTVNVCTVERLDLMVTTMKKLQANSFSSAMRHMLASQNHLNRRAVNAPQTKTDMGRDKAQGGGGVVT